MKLFTEGDGTGRELRESQEYVLRELRKVWFTDNKPIVILGQTGLGKSMLARTIQKQTGAAIVTPQNTLIKQYVKDYPELNYWWGANHFKCHRPGFHLSDCEYTKNRVAAIEGKDTIFNPMSLYFLRKVAPQMKQHKYVVIDEAHAVLSMLRGLSVISLDVKETVAPKKLEVIYNLREWLEERIEHATGMVAAYEAGNETRKANAWKNKLMKLTLTLDGINFAPENYAIKYDPENEKINIQNTWLPPKISSSTFGPGRKILMSGTIFRPDVLELLDTSDYHLIEPPSAIPVENRPIHYRPFPFKVNYQTEKDKIAYFITRILDEYGSKHRTIIHVPYSWAQPIAAAINRPSLILHDKDSKEEALEKFKRTKNGVLIACGMSEGIDLKGDLCRLNIIPKLLWPNLGDDFVLKKSGQGPEGKLWYLSETAKTVIQQAGRSTRGPDDWSTTIIMDPSFERLLKSSYNFLPKSFLEAIKLHR